MNKLKMILAGLLIVPTIALAVAPAVNAANFTLRDGINSAQGEGVDKVNSSPESLVHLVIAIRFRLLRIRFYTLLLG